MGFSFELKILKIEKTNGKNILIVLRQLFGAVNIGDEGVDVTPVDGSLDGRDFFEAGGDADGVGHFAQFLDFDADDGVLLFERGRAAARVVKLHTDVADDADRLHVFHLGVGVIDVQHRRYQMFSYNP